MADTWGRNIRITLFGESHGPQIGVVLDGLPARLEVDIEAIQRDLDRRAPGRSVLSTPRKENDIPRIVSGLYQGKTTGSALCALFQNSDTRSGDYAKLKRVPRPGHADFTGMIRYAAANDPRGGGHFSGRLTAPLVFAGSLARQYLKAEGICVGAHIQSIAGIADAQLDACTVDANMLEGLSSLEFAVLDQNVGEAMKAAIDEARRELDSLGGTIECVVVGLPAGWGDPFFESIESRLAAMLFSVPAVKGVAFGSGFDMATMRASEANDAFVLENGKVRARTNHNGGINGGITNGMPLVVKVAVKPTPSISKTQETLDLDAAEVLPLQIQGRHDPCIVPRAVVVIEAAVALVLLDAALEAKKQTPYALTIGSGEEET